MDIYWIEDKKKCGPVTVPDIISRVQMGELSPDTKGWHAGCEQWMPLRELPALADFLKEKPAEEERDTLPLPEEAVSPEDDCPAGIPENAVRVYLPSPASRLLARLVDMSLYTAVFYTAVYLRQISFDPALLPSNPLMWLGFVVLEALLVYFLGGTPGKFLLGIQVRRVGEESMTIGCSLARSFMAFIGGMGMMVSLLPLFMMGFSWWQLRTRGMTMWDARCRTLPIMFKPMMVLRQFTAVFIIMITFNITLSCMEPWLEPMVQQVEQQSPEMGQMLRSMMPPAKNE